MQKLAYKIFAGETLSRDEYKQLFDSYQIKYPSATYKFMKDHRDNSGLNTYEKVASLMSLPKGKILDLGCGDGSLCKYLDGLDYYGVDWCEVELEIAKRNYPLSHFSCSDISKLPFDDSYFDGLISHMVLHITSNLSDILTECFRILKADTKMVAFTRLKNNNDSLAEVRKVVGNFVLSRWPDFKIDLGNDFDNLSDIAISSGFRSSSVEKHSFFQKMESTEFVQLVLCQFPAVLLPESEKHELKQLLESKIKTNSYNFGFQTWEFIK